MMWCYNRWYEKGFVVIIDDIIYDIMMCDYNRWCVVIINYVLL